MVFELNWLGLSMRYVKYVKREIGLGQSDLAQWATLLIWVAQMHETRDVRGGVDSAKLVMRTKLQNINERESRMPPTLDIL